MAQPFDDALSKCVLRPGALGCQLKLHGRGQALSARTVARATTRAEISPFDLLVGDAAVCMSAGDPASTRHLR
jgi:hypothetical protein